MEGIKGISPVSHGKTVRTFRHLVDLTVEDVAEHMHITPEELSKLEEQHEWTEENLQKAADALGIPVEILKDFDPQTTVNNIVTNNGTVTDSSSMNNVNGTNEIRNYMHDTEKIMEIYDDLVLALKYNIRQLEKEIEELKNK